VATWSDAGCLITRHSLASYRHAATKLPLYTHVSLRFRNSRTLRLLMLSSDSISSIRCGFVVTVAVLRSSTYTDVIVFFISV